MTSYFLLSVCLLLTPLGSGQAVEKVSDTWFRTTGDGSLEGSTGVVSVL